MLFIWFIMTFDCKVHKAFNLHKKIYMYNLMSSILMITTHYSKIYSFYPKIMAHYGRGSWNLQFLD